MFGVTFHFIDKWSKHTEVGCTGGHIIFTIHLAWVTLPVPGHHETFGVALREGPWSLAAPSLDILEWRLDVGHISSRSTVLHSLKPLASAGGLYWCGICTASF